MSRRDGSPPAGEDAAVLAGRRRAAAGGAFLGVERSVTGRAWRARGGDERTALALAQAVGLPEIVGRILAARGIGVGEADGFLNPRLRSALPNPSRLRDMDGAAERLAGAVLRGETVGILGDYDVDGATATALVRRFFEAVGAGVLVHIPDRLAEGYGPNAPALLGLKRKGAGVVVTVDCGVTAFEPLEQAAAAGLDVVVVDHHMAEPRLPRAVAVVNPNRLDETGEHGGLAAAGVAFLLVVAVNRALRQAGWYRSRPEPDLREWLDLVALGTVCDMVPLTGLNRVLVAQGLKALARRKNVGLAALADAAGLREPPGAYHLGFILGPRINAGGRIGVSDLGARLLATDDPAEARALAQRLDALNAERRAVEVEVLDEAVRQVERSSALLDGALLLAHGPGWHPGIVGLVAGRLVERFHRPAVVVGLDEGVGKGSGRSVVGFDIGAAVIAARQAGLLLAGGGHRMAAGLTVAEPRLADLRGFLEERLATSEDATAGPPPLAFDGALAVSAATADLALTLERVGPFGEGNPEPRFAITHARVVRADVLRDAHVRCVLAGADGGRLPAIAFRSVDTPLGQALLAGGAAPLHVAGALRAESYRGERRLQLFVQDAAPVGR